MISCTCIAQMLIDWFAAGKGPDPVKKGLDDEMDEYFKGKTTKVDTQSA